MTARFLSLTGRSTLSAAVLAWLSATAAHAQTPERPALQVKAPAGAVHHAPPHRETPRPAAPHAHPPSHPTAAHPAARPVAKAPAPKPAVAPAVPVTPTAAETPAEPTLGTETHLKIPRFVSLRGETVNFRAGPGRRYPIDWVYQRRDLPVEITREFENWRLVEDQDGIKGWVHQATLAARRTIVVTGAERVLRSDASDTANAVAQLMPGVVARLRSCAATAAWCQISVQDYRGWLKRTEFWGIEPGEEVQ